PGPDAPRDRDAVLRLGETCKSSGPRRRARSRQPVAGLLALGRGAHLCNRSRAVPPIGWTAAAQSCGSAGVGPLEPLLCVRGSGVAVCPAQQPAVYLLPLLK